MMIVKRDRVKCNQRAAINEQFGTNETITRPKVCANLQILRPSERQ
ncbi:MAG: hypothetical protein FWD66_05710 [Paludibacter sp.]|nr:hypothetical protein [Paludibacter sp.]